MSLIFEKVFRRKENEKKVHFILGNTNLTFELIQKAAVLATRPPYHTFGHGLGATEQVIRIAKAEGLEPSQIDLAAFAMLFHDAGHKGIVQLYDEMHSFSLLMEVLQLEDVEMLKMPPETALGKMRDLIVATTFTNRAKIKDPLSCIVQDADLAHLGLGVHYWMWASMGLVDEFSRQRSSPLTPEIFIREMQEGFVKYLASLTGTGKVYLSEGANAILNDPLEDVKKIKALPVEAINFAYSVRQEDITLEEFGFKFDSYL